MFFPLQSGVRKFAAPIVLLFLSVVPYLNSLPNGFVYDDASQVVNNPYIRSFNIGHIFGQSVWSFLPGYRGTSNYYRPVMTLGYAICYRLFGLRPFGFHLVSLLLNAAVVLLLFGLTRKMFGNQAIAFAAAALFAIHPIHSEAVDWIAAVTEIEVALFFIATFWIYLAASEKTGMRRVAAQIGMCAAFVLALLAKEQAMTLPLLVTLYEHLYRSDCQSTTWKQKLLRYAPLWILDGAYILLRTRVLKGFAPVVSRPQIGIHETVLGAIALFAQYMWKLVWPARLSLAYFFPDDVYRLAPWMLAGLLVSVVCAVLCVLLWRRARPVSFGLLWIAVTLAPVLNARWMPPSVVGERYLYLPSAGFAWIAGWAAARAWEFTKNWKLARAALATAGGAILIVAGVRILFRNRVWRDNFTLYQHTLAVSPEAYVIRNNYGVLFWNRGDIKDASLQWQQALKVDPDYPYALENLGLAMRSEKRYLEAEQYLVQCLRFAPDYLSAHVELAKTYEDMGQRDKAESEFLAALRLAPSNTGTRDMLGDFYLDEHRFDKAEEQFRRSIDTQPGFRGLLGLGLALWGQNRISSAEKAFLEAESVDASNIRIHLILGLFYANTGRAVDAVQEYQTALAIDPSNAPAWAALKKLEQSKGNVRKKF